MQETPAPPRLIACGVFKPALKYLEVDKQYPHVRLTFLPSNLHMRPQELKSRLRREITGARQNNERPLCLYGCCFPDIDEFCNRHGTIRVPGFHCYEMLLGSEEFQRAIHETAGTYFLEKELIVHFEEYCMKPLELYDEEIRNCCFEHYNRLLYVRQPSDPDLLGKAGEVARFLRLSLEIRDADYSHLKRKLLELI
ncbi:MAG: DUF1638 domain-containing protein [Syntrophobacteria bacterium]